MSSDVPPEPISEIASILASGYLRLRKSRLKRQIQPQDVLAFQAEPSPHATEVNAQRTDQNG
jgi:hypothetical protein